MGNSRSSCKFAFTAAFACFGGHRARLGGVTLGLLLMMHNLLILPLLLLAGKRRRNALVGFAAGARCWIAASVRTSVPAILWTYPQFLRAASTWDVRQGIAIIGMFAWNAFVFLYHFALLGITGWNVSAPAMPAVLLVAVVMTLRRRFAPVELARTSARPTVLPATPLFGAEA